MLISAKVARAPATCNNNNLYGHAPASNFGRDNDSSMAMKHYLFSALNVLTFMFKNR